MSETMSPYHSAGRQAQARLTAPTSRRYIWFTAHLSTMRFRFPTATLCLMLSALAWAQEPLYVKPCGEEQKMEQARAFVESLAKQGSVLLEGKLATTVTLEERNRMQLDMARAAKAVADLWAKDILTVVRVYPEPDESIFRCRFRNDSTERLVIDLHYRTSACKAEIGGLSIYHEPPPDPDAWDDPPPPPPGPPTFIITR